MQKKIFTIRLISVFFALVLSGIFLLILNLNPFSVYGSMLKGAFGSPYTIRQTIITAIPLLIAALGVAVAFKMQFWNIGGEGQIIMGAFGAALIALKMPNMPKPALLLLMLVVGSIFGGIWSLIPAFFKVNWSTNETIVTLMMNYIALKFVTYLQYGPWRDKTALGFPKIPNFSDNAILPDIFKVHIGWVIAIILAIVIFVYMNYTKKGYEVAVIGESEKTAIYAGIGIKKTVLSAVFLSGALCGITGAIQASAVSHTLSVEVSGGVGYTAIIVAWLGSLSSLGMVFVAILFAALIEGGSFIQTAFGIPEAAALILQSMILFFVLGSEFFIKYKMVFKKIENKLEEAV